MRLKSKSMLLVHVFVLGMQMFCSSELFAEDTAFADLSFDENIAGMNCENPKCSWGTQGNDLLLIDNVNTYSSAGNALLFERPDGYKSGGWGAGMNLPQKPYDWLKIQIAFLFDGTATKATASLELREHYNKRLYFASLGSAKGKDPIVLIDGGEKWKTSKANSFDRKVWNRITWYVPSVTASDMRMHLMLETWSNSTRSWQAVGEIGSMEASKVEKPFAAFRINFPGGEEAIRLRFDDMKIEPITNEQMSSLVK